MSKSHNKLDNDLKKQSLKGLLSLAGVADNERLSKRKSGKPYRHTLAIFMPKNRGITTPRLPQGIDTLRHILDVLTFQHIPSYDGMTLLNKKAERQIGRAVAFTTESKSRHPLPVLTVYRVAITQKVKGGYHA